MNPDPFFDTLRRLRVPPPDPSAKARALHRARAALGSVPAPEPAQWTSFLPRGAAIPALLACLVLLAWIGETERRHAEETSALRLVLGQMEATFQNRLAAIVLTPGDAKVVLSGDDAPVEAKPVLLTVRGDRGITQILTFSGRWFDLPVNGIPIHVQVMETGSGRFVLAGDGFLWDGSRKPVDGLRIQGRFL